MAGLYHVVNMDLIHPMSSEQPYMQVTYDDGVTDAFVSCLEGLSSGPCPHLHFYVCTPAFIYCVCMCFPPQDLLFLDQI